MRWRSMRPTSVEIVVAFFGRPLLPSEFLDCDRLAIKLALLGGVPTSGDLAEQNFRLTPGFLRSPNAVQADREATRAAGGAILHNIASLSRGEDAQPEPGKIVVP
jgi:hypothetical protein